MSLTYFKKPFKDNHRIPYSILKLQTVTTNKRPRNVVGCLWGAYVHSLQTFPATKNFNLQRFFPQITHFNASQKYQKPAFNGLHVFKQFVSGVYR